MWGIAKMAWEKGKGVVRRTAQRMLEKGLVVGTSGNVSLRLPPEGGRELLAITPNRRYYEDLKVSDIQVIDFEAEPVEGELAPSIETMLHIGIYRARKDVGAVIHTHSLFASVLAVAGLGIPPILDEQIISLGGEVKVARYAPPGSEELVQNALEALEERNAVLLANHGVVGVGRDMREALTVCEVVERMAQVYLLGRLLGRINPLPSDVVEGEKAIFKLLHTVDKEGL